MADTALSRSFALGRPVARRSKTRRALVFQKAAMINRSSCRFFLTALRLQPVRRLERSIRLESDGRGRPC